MQLLWQELLLDSLSFLEELLQPDRQKITDEAFAKAVFRPTRNLVEKRSRELREVCSTAPASVQMNIFRR